MLRRITLALFGLLFTIGLAGCGDTWEGAKTDTGQNLESTGETIEDAGEDVKD